MSFPAESVASASPAADRTSESATDLKTTVDAGRPRGRGAWLLAIVIGAACLILGYAIRQRGHAEKVAAAFTAGTLVPTVAVHTAEYAQRGAELSLPGTLEPRQKAQIHSRATGYVKRWNVDIGQHVAAGDVLAQIETPDLDQNVRQAEADVAQAKADLVLAKANAERYGVLMKEDAVSRQDYDTRVAQRQASEARFSAAEAALARQRELMQFQSVVAPFEGIVTVRQIDVGTLVTTAAAGNGLFTIAQVDVLRVFVDVPQAYADSVKPGMEASIQVPEQPAHRVNAHVVRTAGALDPVTRTMRVELNVPNRDRALTAGAFVEVHLEMPANRRALMVPVTAVRIRADGPRILVVDASEHIRVTPVSIGRDLGAELEITGGLRPGDRVVRNPNDLLRAGVPVRVIEEAKR